MRTRATSNLMPKMRERTKEMEVEEERGMEKWKCMIAPKKVKIKSTTMWDNTTIRQILTYTFMPQLNSQQTSLLISIETF